MYSFHKKYYEQPVLWDSNFPKRPEEKERIFEIIKIIPSDTKSILDVGCGNGFFVNTLSNTFSNRFNRVIGLDPSKEALKYVKTEKTCGTITELPFENESFDLVTSLEVLEHLPHEDYNRGISELKRVSRKHIIITVPNNQDLKTSLVMCPQCFCWFNPDYHTRNFNQEYLEKLFIGFKPVEIKEIGPLIKYRSYNHFMLAYYFVWKKPVPPTHSICPQCGYQRKVRQNNGKTDKKTPNSSKLILYTVKPFANLFFPLKKKKRWLLVLYGKSDGQI